MGKADPFIVDCGSNIGLSVIYFKNLCPHSRIIAFEPDALSYSCLKTNVQQNRFSSVESHQKALSDFEGFSSYYYDENRPGSLYMSLYQERLPRQEAEVAVTKLSQYINEPVDLLKMDIEGAETAVLNDLQKSEKLSLINKMIIEYHHHLEEDEDNLSSFLGTLESAGLGTNYRANYQDLYSQKYIRISSSMLTVKLPRLAGRIDVSRQRIKSTAITTVFGNERAELWQCPPNNG